MQELIGIIGATIVLVAFALNQTGRWNRDMWQYDLANAVGSILLIAYAIFTNSLPFFILNVVWAVFSAKDLIQKRN